MEPTDAFQLLLCCRFLHWLLPLLCVDTARLADLPSQRQIIHFIHRLTTPQVIIRYASMSNTTQFYTSSVLSTGRWRAVRHVHRRRRGGGTRGGRSRRHRRGQHPLVAASRGQAGPGASPCSRPDSTSITGSGALRRSHWKWESLEWESGLATTGRASHGVPRILDSQRVPATPGLDSTPHNPPRSPALITVKLPRGRRTRTAPGGRTRWRMWATALMTPRCWRPPMLVSCCILHSAMMAVSGCFPFLFRQHAADGTCRLMA